MIDLCSTSSSDDEGHKSLVLSPIKPRIIGYPLKKQEGLNISDPLEIIKQLIPHVTESDYHYPAERSIPVGMPITRIDCYSAVYSDDWHNTSRSHLSQKANVHDI